MRIRKRRRILALMMEGEKERVGIIIASPFRPSLLPFLDPLIHELFGRRASNRLFRAASFFPPFLVGLAAEPNECVL